MDCRTILWSSNLDSIRLQVAGEKCFVNKGLFNQEEQIRAEAAADGRALIDTFIDVVKQEIPDEQARDRIARALLDRCPGELTETDVN